MRRLPTQRATLAFVILGGALAAAACTPAAGATTPPVGSTPPAGSTAPAASTAPASMAPVPSASTAGKPGY